MLSRGCCEIPLRLSAIYNYRKARLEHGTWNKSLEDRSGLLLLLNIRVKKEGKKNRTRLKKNKGNRVTNMIAIEKSLPAETKKILRPCPREKPRENA